VGSVTDHVIFERGGGQREISSLTLPSTPLPFSRKKNGISTKIKLSTHMMDLKEGGVILGFRRGTVLRCMTDLVIQSVENFIQEINVIQTNPVYTLHKNL